MKYPTLRFVFDRKKTASKEKNALVQAEIMYGRRRKYVSTGIRLYEGQWKDGQKVVGRLDAIDLNDRLNRMEAAFNEYVRKTFESGYSFDFERAAEKIVLWDGESSPSFVDFVLERAEKRPGIVENTRQQHRTLHKVLLEFGKIITMDDLTRENIALFDEFLHDRGLAQPTISNYHKRMKVNINEAILLGKTKNNPYFGVKIERGKSAKRKYLTTGELKKVQNLETDNERVANARDIFLFQCYTGLSYADVAKFDYSRDVEERNGKKVILGRRKKTNEDYFIVLLSPALEILKKHEYKLPVISNQKYNDALKAVAMYAGISKDLTSHMGRHTFAVWALNEGIPIEVVSKVMGHTNVKTTAIYAKIVGKSIMDAFDALEKKL